MCVCPALQALTSVQRLRGTTPLQALTHAFPRCPSGPTQQQERRASVPSVVVQWPCAYKPFSVPGCQHLAHHADQQENVQMTVVAQGRPGYRQHRLDWEAGAPAEPQGTAFKTRSLLWDSGNGNIFAITIHVTGVCPVQPSKHWILKPPFPQPQKCGSRKEACQTSC